MSGHLDEPRITGTMFGSEEFYISDAVLINNFNENRLSIFYERARIPNEHILYQPGVAKTQQSLGT
jgi:hypothetical protein